MARRAWVKLSATYFLSLSMNTLCRGLFLLAQSQPISVSAVTQRYTHHFTSSFQVHVLQICRPSDHNPVPPHSTANMQTLSPPSERFRNLPTLRQPRNRILKFPPTNRNHRIPRLALRHNNTQLILPSSQIIITLVPQTNLYTP